MRSSVTFATHFYRAPAWVCRCSYTRPEFTKPQCVTTTKLNYYTNDNIMFSEGFHEIEPIFHITHFARLNHKLKSPFILVCYTKELAIRSFDHFGHLVTWLYSHSSEIPSSNNFGVMLLLVCEWTTSQCSINVQRIQLQTYCYILSAAEIHYVIAATRYRCGNYKAFLVHETMPLPRGVGMVITPDYNVDSHSMVMFPCNVLKQLL